MNLLKITILLSVVCCISSEATDDLKSYYEKKKAEFVPTFKPPQLGSQVTVETGARQFRTGILMKLDSASLLLLTDSGNIAYQRMALHESSRAIFFVEDFAHVKALESTQVYKNELHKENIKEQAAGLHDGWISVSVKSDKTSDKEVENEERESKNTGEKRTKTKSTRIYTEIQKLKVNVVNNATHTDVFTLKWIFFSQRISKGLTRKGGGDSVSKTIAKQSNGMKRIPINARGRSVVDLSSDPFVVTKIEVSSSSSDQSNRAPIYSGEESAGWLVLLMYEGEILDKKASAKNYLDDEWVNKFK